MFAMVFIDVYLVPSARPELVPTSEAFSKGMSNLKERSTKEKKSIKQILFIRQI